MAATERPYDQGTRQGERHLRTLAAEFRVARLSAGLSQRRVAASARISRPVYTRIERGTQRQLPLLLATRIGAVLGLDVSVRAYPGSGAIRDEAHAQRLRRLLAHVRTPLTYRTEVPLPTTTDHPERRSWDAMLIGRGERTAIELEIRLYDVQAQTRRIYLKRRDDPPDRLVVVVADSRANRRALAEFAELFAELPRLRTANVLRLLSAGEHPPTGLIVL